jgi:hypothetical protein
LASNTQSEWSNGSARGTGLINVSMPDCVIAEVIANGNTVRLVRRQSGGARRPHLSD